MTDHADTYHITGLWNRLMVQVERFSRPRDDRGFFFHACRGLLKIFMSHDTVDSDKEAGSDRRSKSLLSATPSMTSVKSEEISTGDETASPREDTLGREKLVDFIFRAQTEIHTSQQRQRLEVIQNASNRKESTIASCLLLPLNRTTSLFSKFRVVDSFKHEEATYLVCSDDYFFVALLIENINPPHPLPPAVFIGFVELRTVSFRLDEFRPKLACCFSSLLLKNELLCLATKANESKPSLSLTNLGWRGTTWWRETPFDLTRVNFNLENSIVPCLDFVVLRSLDLQKTCKDSFFSNQSYPPSIFERSLLCLNTIDLLKRRPNLYSLCLVRYTLSDPGARTLERRLKRRERVRISVTSLRSLPYERKTELLPQLTTTERTNIVVLEEDSEFLARLFINLKDFSLIQALHGNYFLRFGDDPKLTPVCRRHEEKFKIPGLRELADEVKKNEKLDTVPVNFLKTEMLEPYRLIPRLRYNFENCLLLYYCRTSSFLFTCEAENFVGLCELQNLDKLKPKFRRKLIMDLQGLSLTKTFFRVKNLEFSQRRNEVFRFLAKAESIEYEFKEESKERRRKNRVRFVDERAREKGLPERRTALAQLFHLSVGSSLLR